MRSEITHDYVQCGQDLSPLLPTSYLQFVNGQLQQWFEATATHDGCTYSKGEWRPVPSRP